MNDRDWDRERRLDIEREQEKRQRRIGAAPRFGFARPRSAGTTAARRAFQCRVGELVSSTAATSNNVRGQR